MKILVSNDDGIFSEGLWTLVRELKSVAQVMVVAPHREQSAIGTAVTLRRPLTIQEVRPVVPGVETYSVDGTPADSVILALSKLVKNGVDMVISGVNPGANLGNDVLVSGTVGAAVQGYIRGFPAIAISAATADSLCLNNAAKLATLLAEKIKGDALPENIFLNVNVPVLPLVKIRGIKVTRLAGKSHIDTVEEGHDGKRHYYWLVRQRIEKSSDDMTDIKAIEQGYISITPLHAYLGNIPSLLAVDGFYSDLLQRLQKNQG